MSHEKLEAVELLKTQHHCVNYYNGVEERKITPFNALVIVALTKSYQLRITGSSTRVKKITLLPKQEPKWLACYQTTQAPVLQPSVHWGR